jgi:hypothetical protein
MADCRPACGGEEPQLFQDFRGVEQMSDEKEKDQVQGTSRRDFLKGAATGVIGVAAAGIISGCSPKVAVPEAPTEAAVEGSCKPADWLTADNGMFDWRNRPEEPTAFNETLEADVIVCGGGISGLSSARRSAELGSSVIVLELDDKYDVHGFQCATFNSDMVTRAGAHTDEIEFFNAYMMTHGNRVNPDLIRMWMRESGPAFDWYEEIMPEIGDDYKTNYRSVLYWPRPEGYSTEGHQYKNFIGTIDFTYESWAYAGSLLYQKTLDLGVQYRFQERGYMLTRDANGKVNGVITKTVPAEGAEDAEPVYNKYVAKKGVIICTGYHGTAKDIMKEIGVEEAVWTIRNGQPIPDRSGFGGTGDGHRMLVWEGAQIEPFRQADGTALALLDPVAGFSVNALGKRWHNEDVPCWSLGLELRWQPKMMAWKIYDKNWRECLPYQAMSHQAIDPINKTPWTVPPEGTKTLADGVAVTDGKTSALDYLEQELLAGVGNKEGITIGKYWTWQGDQRFGANTLEELADMMGFGETEKANMLAEIEEYNQMCADKRDTRYGKAASMLFPIKEGPFFAFSTHASNVGRMGQEGIMTNDRLQPIIPDTHEAIPGVYLAGVVVGGRHANQYMTVLSGQNHGFCVTTGKVAAENLAADNA